LPAKNRQKGLTLRIYVGNISKEIDEPQLAEMFAPFGKADSVELAVREKDGSSRGFGFVEMADSKEAEAAMAGLNGKEIGGKVLKVNEARPKGTTFKPLVPIH